MDDCSDGFYCQLLNHPTCNCYLIPDSLRGLRAQLGNYECSGCPRTTTRSRQPAEELSDGRLHTLPVRASIFVLASSHPLLCTSPCVFAWGDPRAVVAMEQEGAYRPLSYMLSLTSGCYHGPTSTVVQVLMGSCWAQQPADRPSFKNIYHQVSKIVTQASTESRA